SDLQDLLIATLQGLSAWAVKAREYGTINRTEVHPREVIKRALYHNAAAVVLAHNHPSGEVTPSKADRLITERLVQALGLVDIRVPDHLIVGGSQVFSFAEHGLL
ncbi:JAB domain-containing protein, partial [Escherichia coli]|uniref:JAB domain-containing protein n=1 Tax=Escherichia coli TaxID=562 RepID=UPI0024BD3203